MSEPRPHPQRYRRHPLGPQLWVGIGILAFYLAVALSATVVFRSHLGTLSENIAWLPSYPVYGPSWAHPFGILSGFGVGLLRAIWQATPWDLAIVFSILAVDAAMGALLGAIAGLREGSAVDHAVSFLSDSIGAVPAVILVVVVFAGIVTLAPDLRTLWLFAIVFGLLLWPPSARTVRERVRTLARQPYVEASRASGASSARIIFRHLLPNSLGPVLAQIPIDVAAIFFVLGVYPWFFNCASPYPGPGSAFHIPDLPPFSPLPTYLFPEWGYYLGFSGCEAFLSPGGPYWWWMFLFPLLAIVGLGLAIALVCDGLEKWLRFGS
ncbi:MAG: ABC transporter permease subunit [Thermoplasmata archaeon]